MNLVGAVLLGVAAITIPAVVALNIVWFGVAAYGLWQSVSVHSTYTTKESI